MGGTLMGNFSDYNSRFFNCCKGCTPETGRSITCHSTCEKYLKDKEERDKVLKAKRNEQLLIFDDKKAPKRQR